MSDLFEHAVIALLAAVAGLTIAAVIVWTWVAITRPSHRLIAAMIAPGLIALVLMQGMYLLEKTGVWLFPEGATGFMALVFLYLVVLDALLYGLLALYRGRNG